MLQWDFPREKYDCIASIATFHHLPLEVMLQKAKDALKPGGVLLILDLFQVRMAAGFADGLRRCSSKCHPETGQDWSPARTAKR